ncbi:MAG: SPOR domain-containing protein [Flavobacteriales bacterium]
MHLNQFCGLRSLAISAMLCIFGSSHHSHAALPSSSNHPIAIRIHSSGNEEIVKGLFTRRTQMDPLMAYETSFFKDLVERQKTDNKKLQHHDDIKKLNEELSRIEAEKANGENPKLNEKEEKLRKEKAHYEIQDAAVLSYYTQSEYDRLTVKVSEVYAANKPRIELREMIYNEIQYLFEQSETQMQEAAETMAKGYTMQEEIDQAKNGRLSFAMEALGIEQMNQILEIISQLDMLLTYSNDQLLEMKNGRSAGEGRGTVIVVEKPQESIEVTLSKPVADVVKIEETVVEPAQALVKEEEREVVKEELKMPEVTYSESEVKKQVAVEKETNAPVKKTASVKSKGEFKCVSIKESEGTFFTVQLGSFNKELSDLSAYRKFTNLYLDNTDGVHYRYTTGQFTSVEEAFEFVQSLHSKGYPDAFVTAVSAGERITISNASKILGNTTR